LRGERRRLSAAVLKNAEARFGYVALAIRVRGYKCK